MYKVGICGHFAVGEELVNGQVIKSKVITSELKRLLGDDAVAVIDTHSWKQKPLKLLINSIKLFKSCENIIIMPSYRGVKVFVPLFAFLNRISKKKLHYIVIGGWLHEYIKKYKFLKKRVSEFDGVYVETVKMADNLVKLGLDNTRYFPNFKRIDIVSIDEIDKEANEPMKLCTLSRVMEEKGIEDAIKSVVEVNEKLGRIAYTLDIYGKVEDFYMDRFEVVKKSLPDYVKYMGYIDYNKTTAVLKNYFALLFPTYYKGEGMPGTIIDAYSAGLPVIATDWKYNSELIKHNIEGILYDVGDKQKLTEILLNTADNPDMILDMKENCLRKAREYLPEKVMGEFVKYLA